MKNCAKRLLEQSDASPHSAESGHKPLHSKALVKKTTVTYLVDRKTTTVSQKLDPLFQLFVTNIVGRSKVPEAESFRMMFHPQIEPLCHFSTNLLVVWPTSIGTSHHIPGLLIQ
jgi:hypothetical protein